MSILNKNSISAKINLANSMKSTYKIIEWNEGIDKNITKKYTENWKKFNDVFKDIKKNIQENKNKTFTFYKFEPDNLKKTINDLSNLENNLKLDEESATENREVILDYYKDEYLKEHSNEIYKPIFDLNFEKLKRAIDFEENFSKVKSALVRMKTVDKLGYEINIKKENDNIEFKAIQYNNKIKVKEYKADNYIDFKKQVFEEFTKKIANEQDGYEHLVDYLKNGYYDEIINKDFKIEIEQDFKLSYKDLRKDNTYSQPTHLYIDLGKEKYHQGGYNNLNDLGLLLTSKDYVGTYTKERDVPYGNLYMKVDELKKVNEKIYDNLIKMRDNETWENIVNDVKANSVMNLNSFDDIESIKTNTLKNIENYFEKRIFMKYKAEEFLEKMILKEDKEFSHSGLHLVEIDDKKRIEEFLEKNDNNTYDFEIYRGNAKEFLSNKVVEVMQTVIDDFKDIESEKYPSVKFQDLQINYANKETGTLRKENEFIKNAFAIYLEENKPYKKEADKEGIKEFLKENKELKKDFSKEMFKKYNILVFQKEVNKIIERFNPNNYDFLVETKFDKYFGKTKYYEKEEITNNKKSKEKEIDM